MEKEKMPKTEEEWKKKLSKEQFEVLRKKSTEMPFTGKLLYNKETGIYRCGACEQELFSSNNKFESGTGWPSYDRPINEKAIKEIEDKSLFTKRIEIVCSNCGSHLGHVFDDGPTDTGKRYCVNSCSLDFKKGEKK
ncbi:MAG: peptide-methionine (R)-S-oxide reductase MsrB [archaeon]|nr:peptide-methionine (R)-S-oxide reductase MsrB [archaeon]